MFPLIVLIYSFRRSEAKEEPTNLLNVVKNSER